MTKKNESRLVLENGPHTNELPMLLKALGHPSRVAIIECIAKNTTCCGGDICSCLDLAQSTVSQHLEILKKAGLVEVKACGTKSMFCLNREKLFKLGESLQAISNSTCCASTPQVIEN